MINRDLRYRNEKWLRRKYWDEELSTYQIAEQCGVSAPTINDWLRGFDVPRRSDAEAVHIRYGNHCSLSQEAIEWISGELLGDGCIFSHSSWSACFLYGSKYSEYVEYVSNTLKIFGIKQSGRIRKQYYKRNNCYGYFYRSISYVELLPVRKQWYPDGKKIVPRDLKLTPLVCRQWYIGDGCLKKPRRGGPYITLATDAFPVLSVKWLVGQLVNLRFRATRWKSENEISISAYSTKDFLDYIGECPVECYQYKWDYQKGNLI